MKLITLNIWGGKVYTPLINFIKEESKTIDIFCFQEVFNRKELISDSVNSKWRYDIYSQIENVLSDHQGFFAPSELDFGLATFVRKSIRVSEEGDIFVHRWKNAKVEGDNTSLGRNLQYIKITFKDKVYTIGNLHGIWNGKGKTDTQDRIEQSNKINSFLDHVKGSQIVCGDFNLLPDTKSLTILESKMINLIKVYNITSTRTKLYIKPDKFADYILNTPDITIKEFKVLKNEVSDHSPLYLEFI